MNASGAAYLQDSRTAGTPWMPLSLVADYPSGRIAAGSVALQGHNLFITLLTSSGSAYETVCMDDPTSLTAENLNSRCSAFTTVTPIP